MMGEKKDAVKIVMQMVEYLCSSYGWKNHVSPGGGESHVDVTLHDGTRKRVCIFGRRDLNGQPVMVFYTPVVAEQHLKKIPKVMKLNYKINHSHFAIVKEKLVVLDTQLVVTADYEELAKKIVNVAGLAKSYGEKYYKGVAL